ncbi:MAG: Gfo/Idh/MocA family protein, partial [Candidatus Humimicrobiaceae bacterium]
MEKIRSAIIGAGYISDFHIDAVRRLGNVDILAISDIDDDLAKKKALEHYIPNSYSDFNEVLSNKSIDVVHNCTPNYLHFEINKKIIESGKHVFSEKPLALNSEEGNELVAISKKNPEIITGVNFNYRMNPLVLEMQQKIKNGEIGKPLIVHGSYLQDWLLFDTDYNWRVDSKIGGNSRCVADIGSHWIDLAQIILNDEIDEVFADLVTIHKKRKKPLRTVETFSQLKENDYEEIEINNEDYGSV